MEGTLDCVGVCDTRVSWLLCVMYRKKEKDLSSDAKTKTTNKDGDDDHVATEESHGDVKSDAEVTLYNRYFA